jgi:hypothetical protein
MSFFDFIAITFWLILICVTIMYCVTQIAEARVEVARANAQRTEVPELPSLRD